LLFDAIVYIVSSITSNNSNSHIAGGGGGGGGYTSEENEEVTLQILETIGQLGEAPERSLGDTLVACMDLIQSHHVRMYILNHLLDVLPNNTTATTTTNKKNSHNNAKMNTLRALVSVLDDPQRKELASIVNGLPPSVFGDPLAREQTRVLVDLAADTKECAHIDKLRMGSQRKFVETVIEMFQQTLSSLTANEQTRTIVGVLHKQLPALRMKIALKQLVFSRCLQPDYSSREEFMQQLLLANSFITNDDPNHTPPTTTTTTSTSARTVNSQPHFIEEM